MKKARLIFILVLMVGFMLGITQSEVWARTSDTPQGGSAIVTDGQAKGTKLSGPLTIYYADLTTNEQGITSGTMYFFMRLRQGHTLWIFGGMRPLADYNNISMIQDNIEDFVGQTVVPALFGQTVEYWALKSVDQVIEPDDPTATNGCCGGMSFTIMDVVIAVTDEVIQSPVGGYK